MIENLKLILLLVSLTTLLSCDDDKQPEPLGELLISYEEIARVHRDEITANNFGSDSLVNQMAEWSTVYKISYRTESPSGGDIVASGAVVRPDGNKALPLLSYQHDTFILTSWTPSEFSNRNPGNRLWSGIMLASLGYLVSAPDYLGYGATRDLIHPYHHASSLATASYDMILATQELSEIASIPIDQKLFLSGFSEGGYATIALQKYMEETHPEVTITASSAGAGAYYLSDAGNSVLSRDEYPIAGFLGLLFNGYDDVYNLEGDMSRFFQEPYGSLIDGGLFDGNLAGDQAEQLLTTDLNRLLQPKFKSDYLDPSVSLPLRDKLEENDLIYWAPKSRTFLYHGANDAIVDVSSAQTAYENFVNNGSKEVELIVFPNLGHSDAYNPYFQATIQQFEKILSNE
ncbi:MAG: lipase family protein [Cyclobacteriaceae bacterium]